MARRQAAADVTPVRQRTQYSCMASSMAMCLRALGHDVSEDEVNKVIGARPMKGAAWEQALACAQHYGCRATLTMPSTVEQLRRWTAQGIPVMIAWNPEGRPWSHASVVYDVDSEGNVFVADPNIPNPNRTTRIVSEDDFYGKWFEEFPNYLVRRPACAISREITGDGRQVMAKYNDSRGAATDSRYKGNPDGDPIYDTVIDHGVDQPLAGGSNVMKALQNEYRKEQGRKPREENPRLANRTVVDVSGREWGPRRGLEGPFRYRGGAVLYYDPREGKYYDPTHDMYLDNRDAVRLIMASRGTKDAPKTKEQKKRDKGKIKGEAPTQRNPVSRGLAERGGRGSGKHQNKKRDFAKGRRRKDKRNRRLSALAERVARRYLDEVWRHQESEDNQ